ncbi:hypothetical protein ACFFKC_14470 [Pseudoduganella danionis]|uniref:Anti-sigma factor n=1 Tax=Pseudoduganella danionis TaxID=1890295 RepID=A0ABW9SM38_9BURK|nr:hypothetical protein [Pseudoduganella danionis]MTW33097.1 hypothetical protein [Pseudoduganella danionis]
MDRTTRFSDQILQAYADGVLDAATSRALESAMQHDSALALRVAQLRRKAIGAASAEAGVKAGAKVVQLAGVRAERAAAARKAGQRRWGGLEWSVLALVIALVLGLILLGLYGSRLGWWPSSAATSGTAPAPLASASSGIAAVAAHDGSLLAQGSLLVALNQQPGGRTTPDGEIRMGQSFMTQEGNYCRSFSLLGMQQDLTGLACREEGVWQVPLLVQNRRNVPALGSHRNATGDMPALLQEAIRQRKAGTALDAQAEELALQRRWQHQ